MATALALALGIPYFDLGRGNPLAGLNLLLANGADYFVTDTDDVLIWS